MSSIYFLLLIIGLNLVLKTYCLFKLKEISPNSNEALRGEMKQSKEFQMTGQLSGKMLSSLALWFLFKRSRRPVGVWRQTLGIKEVCVWPRKSFQLIHV